MNIKQILITKPGVCALMVLMLVTRFDHFGSAFSLPDASMAVFFLAGLWFGGRYLFAALLVEAGLIDYLAITQFGVSDFCISPAYGFLLPTYLAMWLGGRYSAQFTVSSLFSVAKLFLVMVISTSVAYLISNASFYLLSDVFPTASWSQFAQGFSRYYLSYLGSTLLYGMIIVAVVSVVKSFVYDKNHQEVI